MDILTRTQKARLMRVFHVRRLVFATLAATVAGALWNGIAAFAHLFGASLPSAWTLPLAIALPTALHLLRMWAAGRGWNAVCVQELPNLPACLEATPELDHTPEDRHWSLPLRVQADIARLARRYGWVAWSDIDAVLAAHGCPPRAAFLSGGAGTERIARRADFAKWLAPAATLDVAMPLAPAVARRRL